MCPRKVVCHFSLPTFFILTVFIAGFVGNTSTVSAQVVNNNRIGAAFEQAASESGVPTSLLKALCYMEGRLSMHGGSPSVDNGYGCMHLVKNDHADTLDQAADLLHVSASQVQIDLISNIRGGAAVLRAEALQLSDTLPTSLAGWYGTIADYSHATVRSTALMYADALYKLLDTGFIAQTDTGEVVTLAAEPVRPITATAATVSLNATMPAGCSASPTGDYPAAVNCILDPNIFDCTLPKTAYPPCNYEERSGASYPLPVNFVVIHDTEGSLQSALDVFQNPDPKTSHGASANYIVDSDGTVYQMVHDVDFTYNVGNYWYNQHSVGIEHVGFDATGFQWYNASQYLGSARLVAYLLKKYNLPLDREHIVAHGTVQASHNASENNHVDPGPYWLWPYYFKLIHDQGVAYPDPGHTRNTVEIDPKTGQRPYGKNRSETSANFNFFYLYRGPSTASGLIPYASAGSDITDETNNIESLISYYYLAKIKDPAGTGDTMYEIWYGEEDNVNSAKPPVQGRFFANAHRAWLAVPPGNGREGHGQLAELNLSGASTVKVYSNPITLDSHVVGDAPNGSVFVTGFTAIEDGTTNLWYEINYNHRQGWVPASEVTIVHPA